MIEAHHDIAVGSKFHIGRSVALIIPEGTVAENDQRHRVCLTGGGICRIVKMSRHFTVRTVIFVFFNPGMVDQNGF